VYQVFSGNCANLTSLSCVDSGTEGETESGVVNNLTIGQTYYIRVHDWLDDIPNTLTFGICVEQFTQCSLQQPSGSILETESCGADLNGGCNANPPIYQSLTCGDTVFGSSWATGGNRDLDWYGFTLNSPGNVTLNAQAEFPYYLYLVDISNCANPIILTSANYNACQNGMVSYNFSTNGSYAAIIAPSLFDGYPCGTFNDYILSINLPPVIAQISASSTNICPNTTATLSGLTSANYTWYLNGVNFSNGPTAQVSLPGSYTASYTDINGCLSGSNSILLQTLPLDNASFVYPTNTVCVGSGNISPTAQSSGIYSSNSTGLVFVSSASGEIDITNSIEGNYIITFQTNGACPASSTQSFVITSTPNASFNYSDTFYCQNSTNQLVILGQNASIGIFSSNSNNLNLSASTGEINLTQSEIGTYTIYNTILASGTCPETIDSFEVQVQGPNVIFPDQGVFCPSSNATQLTATPVGGNFAGLSIQNNLFNPSLGSCLVTYILTDQYGCIDSASQFITVESTATLIFGQYPELCSNGTPISLDQGLPSGGFYTGNGVSGVSFSPSQGVLGSNILTYHFTSSNGCSDSITGVIVINESPTVTFQPLPTICDTTAALVLGGVAPIGGTFSGIGVIGATFIPSIAGVGMHSITYTYTLNNCSSSATQSITVDQCSDIQELSHSVKIFPNPVSQSFQLSGFIDAETVELHSLEGKVILTLDSKKNEFDISDLPPSNYLLKITTKTQTYNLKLIKI
ncbi:MAG: T9SS type A sorting domain-containing protein, partial [Bacteroidota bacterium]